MIDIKTNVDATFIYYRDGSLWYQLPGGEIFPVPVDDIGTATFNAVESARMLMRYMRKWNEEIA